jgi:hypothetical protein
VGEIESQEAEDEESGGRDTTTAPIPDILPASPAARTAAPSPPHTLTFYGRQWTMAQLEELTSQQNDKNASRMRAAGWGVLN